MNEPPGPFFRGPLVVFDFGRAHLAFLDVLVFLDVSLKTSGHLWRYFRSRNLPGHPADGQAWRITASPRVL